MEFQMLEKVLANRQTPTNRLTVGWGEGSKRTTPAVLVIRWRSSSAAAALPLEQYSSGSAALQKRHGHACSKRGIGGRRALAVYNRTLHRRDLNHQR